MTTALILGCEGPILSSQEADFFRELRPWGFILFARNLETGDQIRRLCADLRQAAGHDAPILIDQEGGRVARLTPPLAMAFPPALDQVENPRAFWLRGRLIAHDLMGLGINVNCAPLADIAYPHTHEILQNRCYGWNVGQVIENARAITNGMAAGGVMGVLKHIPGHGRANLDSHLDLPVVDTCRRDLNDTDFRAFKALNDLPMAMTAHIIYSDIDPHHPATLSADMIQIIRRDIGFDGLLMSDDISMNALSGTIAARATGALQAGCDLILHCNGNMDEMQALAHVVPSLSSMAQRRVSNLPVLAPLEENINDLRAEFAAL